MTPFKLCFKIVLFVFGVLSIGAQNVIQPCTVTDSACVQKSAQAALPKIFAGFPELNIESVDPLFLPLIVGDLSTLKYKFFNTTITGYKDSEIKNVKLDLDKMHLSYDFICKNLDLTGDYEINGRLIVLPVEGKGTYHVVAKRYLVQVESDIEKVKGKDGKDHLHMKNFKLNLEAQDGLLFRLNNLFNGNKELSDAVHKFANENWKEVGDFVQQPVFNTGIKKIISIVNKYLKTIPFDDLFVQ